MPYSTVRRVLPHEYPKYRKHLKALDRESKTLRFANPLTDEVIDVLTIAAKEVSAKYA